MNVDDLRVFLQIVASGSLSRAAKAMRRPKASLSHQLRRLEADLGTPLFVRTANEMSLNRTGELFLEHARSVQRACDRGFDCAQQGKDAAATELSLASSSEFASNLVSPIVMHFSRRAPRIRLNVMTFQREVLPEVRQQFDGILYLGDPPLPQFSNMSARLLGRFRFGLYASPRYLSEAGPPQHPKDLLSHNLMGFYDGQSVATWALTDGKSEFQVRPSPHLLSNDYWIVKLSALHDHGICLVPEFFAGLEVRAGLLRRILPQWSSQDVPVYCLFWSHRFANPNVRLLVETAAECFFGTRLLHVFGDETGELRISHALSGVTGCWILGAQPKAFAL